MSTFLARSASWTTLFVCAQTALEKENHVNRCDQALSAIKVHGWQSHTEDCLGYAHSTPVFIQRRETSELHAMAAMVTWPVWVRACCGVVTDHAQAAVNAEGLPHAGGRCLVLHPWACWRHTYMISACHCLPPALTELFSSHELLSICLGLLLVLWQCCNMQAAGLQLWRRYCGIRRMLAQSAESLCCQDAVKGQTAAELTRSTRMAMRCTVPASLDRVELSTSLRA